MKKAFQAVVSLIVLIVVIGLVISAIGGGSKNESTGSSTDSMTKTEEKKAEKPQEQVAGLNQAVQDGDLKFTVLSVDKKKTVGNQYTKKDAQGQFLIISLKLENVGKKTETFNASMAKVMDAEGREFDYSIEAQSAYGMAQGKIDLFMQQIQPSLSYTGDIIFDLPADIKDPTLVLKGSLFGKGAKVRLE